MVRLGFVDMATIVTIVCFVTFLDMAISSDESLLEKALSGVTNNLNILQVDDAGKRTKRDDDDAGDDAGGDEGGGDEGGEKEEGADDGGEKEGGDEGGDKEEGGDEGGDKEEGADDGGDKEEGDKEEGDKEEGDEDGDKEKEGGDAEGEEDGGADDKKEKDDGEDDDGEAKDDADEGNEDKDEEDDGGGINNGGMKGGGKNNGGGGKNNGGMNSGGGMNGNGMNGNGMNGGGMNGNGMNGNGMNGNGIDGNGMSGRGWGGNGMGGGYQDFDNGGDADPSDGNFNNNGGGNRPNGAGNNGNQGLNGRNGPPRSSYDGRGGWGPPPPGGWGPPPPGGWGNEGGWGQQGGGRGFSDYQGRGGRGYSDDGGPPYGPRGSFSDSNSGIGGRPGRPADYCEHSDGRLSSTAKLASDRLPNCDLLFPKLPADKNRPQACYHKKLWADALRCAYTCAYGCYRSKVGGSRKRCRDDPRHHCRSKKANCRANRFNSAYDVTQMQANCPKTCGLCGHRHSSSPSCHDRVTNCHNLKPLCHKGGYDRVRRLCAHTCGLCGKHRDGSCVDKATNCTAGRCNAPGWYAIMTRYCPRTCFRCASKTSTKKATCRDRSGTEKCREMNARQPAFCDDPNVSNRSKKSRCKRTCGFCRN